MPEGVAPSELGAQPIGEAARIVEGVYQLKLPVPFPLRFVSVYLIEGDDGWTLVDTGYDYAPTYESWEAGAVSVGCDLSGDVARIIVTHFHPDHLGGARWLQERSGAPVCMMEEEISFSRRLWGSPDAGPFVEYLIRHGMGREMAEPAAAAVRYGLPLPDETSPLRAGEEIPVGDGAARVLHAPGHADNLLVLHVERRGLLFAADHLLLEITPNIGLWPESEPHPLARYFESLRALRGLDVEIILPGHGPVFHDLDGRIDELLGHHEERLDLMHRVIEAEPKAPNEVSREIFRGAVTLHQRCFALAETLAHLEHLELEGRAECIDNGTIAFEGK